MNTTPRTRDIDDLLEEWLGLDVSTVCTAAVDRAVR